MSGTAPASAGIRYFARRDEPELPARRASDRRQWRRELRVDPPRVLFGTVAAHPLRDLSVAQRSAERDEQDRNVADRDPEAAVRPRVRHVTLLAIEDDLHAGLAGLGQRIQRRL